MTGEHYAYILAVNEKYWSRLCQRNKTTLGTHAFVRGNKVGPEQAEQLLFYVSGPKRMQILGEADFVERIVGDVEDLWRAYGNETCFESLDEYKGFASGRQTMTFVRYRNFKEISSPHSKDELVKVLGSIQRFGLRKYVDKETALKLT